MTLWWLDGSHVEKLMKNVDSDEQIGIPNSVLCPTQAPTELPRTVFPTRSLYMGDRMNFVQEEPLDLQCQNMFLAIYIVGDVSKNQDTLTSEF